MNPFSKRFSAPPYLETPLCEPLAEALASLMLPLAQRQVVFLTGSGISVPDPTGLPTGRQLAIALETWLRANGMGSVVDALADPSDLGEICAAIEQRTNRDTLVRQLLESADWEGADPNLCHFMLALLFGEGLIRRSFTFNWDDKVRNVSRTIDISLSCAVDGDTLRAANDPMFVHLHGHVDHPDKLVATEGDLAGSPLWAEATLESAIHETEIVLIGFAAEPAYLLDSLKRFKEIAGKTPLAIVSLQPLDEFKAASPSLAALCSLGEENSSHFIQGDACETLVNLVRAHYCGETRRLLEQAIARAAQLGGAWGWPSSDSKQWLEEILLAQSLDEFLALIWRGPALGLEKASESRLVPLASCSDDWVNVIAAALILASCADVTSVEKAVDGLRFTTSDGKQVDFWPVIAKEGSASISSASHAQGNSRAFSRSSDAGVPLVLLAEGGWGNPRVGHVSILAEDRPENMMTPGRSVVDAVSISILQDRLSGLDAAPELRKVVTLGAENE